MTSLRAQFRLLLRFIKVRMAYRAAFWIDFAFDTLIIFMQVFVWKALLGADAVDGVSFPEMATYVALSRGITSLTRTSADRIIEDRLESGNICFDLVRPMSFRRQMALTEAGRCLNSLLLQAIPAFLVVAIFFVIVPPVSVEALLLFFLLVAIGVVVSYYIRYIIGLISFFFIKASHLSWLFGTIEGFLSGSLIPLWFYPDWIARIANVAPFKFIVYVPISVYLGKTTIFQLAAQLPAYLIWLGILVTVESFLWRRALKRLVVQGG